MAATFGPPRPDPQGNEIRDGYLLDANAIDRLQAAVIAARIALADM
jgi:hypothetical protein